MQLKVSHQSFFFFCWLCFRTSGKLRCCFDQTTPGRLALFKELRDCARNCFSKKAKILSTEKKKRQKAWFYERTVCADSVLQTPRHAGGNPIFPSIPISQLHATPADIPFFPSVSICRRNNRMNNKKSLKNNRHRRRARGGF